MTASSQADYLLEQLPVLLKAERVRRRVVLRDVAEELGMTISTLHRFEAGTGLPDARGLLMLIGWLRVPGWWFTGDLSEAVADAYRRGRVDAVAAVRSVLDAEETP